MRQTAPPSRHALRFRPELISLEARDIPSATQFTVIGMPDIQNYSEFYPQITLAQTQWIVANRDALDIEFVSQFGDLVNHGYGPNSDVEWANARAGMKPLEDADIPLGVNAGNHCVLESGSPGQTFDPTNFLANFGPQRYTGRSWFGGASPSGLSSYQIFNTGPGEMPMIAIHLAIEYPHAELAWAQGVINANRDKPVMISTHRYMQDAESYTFGVPAVPSGRYPDIWYSFEGHYNPDGIMAEELFNHFIATNRNIFLVNCGHFHEEFHQTSTNRFGLPVHEVLADYQDGPNGGNGFLRIMQFDTSANQISVSSYSPYLDASATESLTGTDGPSSFTLPTNFNSYKAPNPTVYFQNGVSGYSGTQDTWINQNSTNTNYGGSGTITVDDDTANSIFSDKRGQGLLRFDDIIGSGAGKIPAGATITRATLKLTLRDDIDTPLYSPNFNVHFMTRSWAESSTWNSLAGGLTSGSDYSTQIASFSGDNNPDGYNIRFLDVKAAVQQWANGEVNYGLAILPQIISGNDDGIDLYSSESAEIMFRPVLEVEYILPGGLGGLSLREPAATSPGATSNAMPLAEPVRATVPTTGPAIAPVMTRETAQVFLAPEVQQEGRRASAETDGPKKEKKAVGTNTAPTQRQAAPASSIALDAIEAAGTTDPFFAEAEDLSVIEVG